MKEGQVRTVFEKNTLVKVVPWRYMALRRNKLTDRHTNIQYFHLGANNEGYWNYDRMALQMEDVFDVLSVVYPHANFLTLMDASAGHGKRREGGLDEKVMSKSWGCNKDYIMRETVVPELGPHTPTHHIGQRQSMQFEEADEGPFYLTPDQRINQKHPVVTEEVKARQKTKVEILTELKLKLEEYTTRRTYIT